MPSPSELNAQSGIEGNVQFYAGDHGFTKVQLRAGDSVVEAFLHGAHVTRYSKGGYEALWMSTDVVLQENKAIRGGIPICWPQFGPGELPQHGFVRNSSDWTVDSTSHADGVTVLTLQHTDTPKTLAAWPHKFCLKYTLTLSSSDFTTSLEVQNSGTAPFSFTTALHSYFKLHHIDAARMLGFKGLTYLDNKNDRKPEQNEPEQDSFHIAKETDRIYVNTPNDLVIQDGYHGTITLSKNAALPDAVLWNPWVAKAASMGDYNNYGWTNMVCIEAAAIKDPVTLDAGKSWTGSQTITCAVTPDVTPLK